jgi:cellulase (glycosyl hydrolase family 5)
VDSADHPVRLLGMGVPGIEKGQGYPEVEGLARTGCRGWKLPPPEIYGLVRSWGFNSVRVPFSWANLEPVPPTKKAGQLVHHYSQAYLQVLDGVVRGFTSRGVAVILSMQQSRWSPAFRNIVLPSGLQYCQGEGLPAWLYPRGGGVEQMVAAEKAFFTHRRDLQRQLITAWQFVAHRYRNLRLVVGADMLNEAYDLLTAPYPGVAGLTPATIDLKGFFERVGASIHSVNPKLLLIVEDNLSRRTGRFALTDPPDIPNLVFSAHFSLQGGSKDAYRRLSAYEKRAAAWSLPLWLGEMYAVAAAPRGGPEPGWEASLGALLARLEKNDISWTYWAFQRGRFLIKGTTQPIPGLLEIVQRGF